MNYIQGKDCLFQVDLGAGYKNFACVKNFSVDLETEEKEITFTGDGNWKDYDYKALSYTIQLDSVLVIQDGITPTAFDGLEYQTGFLELKYRMLYEQGTNVKVIRGSAIVKKSSLSATANQLADSSITLLGKGAFIDENTLPIFVNLRLLITGSNPIAALVHFKLLNADGDTVFDSAQLPGSSGDNIANPSDITGQVEAGTYYYWWQVDANSDSNLFTLSAPGAVDQPFADGITTKQSFPTTAYDFTANRTATFQLTSYVPPPTCVPPAIVGSPSLPDGTVGTFYTYSFPITGSAPFSITNITKPSWMNIVEQDTGPGTFGILISGTPDVTGTGIAVSFDITNACGSVHFSDTIDVAAAAAPSTISWSYTDSAFASGSLRIYVNSILTVVANPIGGAFQSGSFMANPGDVIQASISGTTGPGSAVKHLTVVDSISGTIFDQNNTITPSFTYTVTNGHNYTITANVH